LKNTTEVSLTARPSGWTNAVWGIWRDRYESYRKMFQEVRSRLGLKKLHQKGMGRYGHNFMPEVSESFCRRVCRRERGSNLPIGTKETRSRAKTVNEVGPKNVGRMGGPSFICVCGRKRGQRKQSGEQLKKLTAEGGKHIHCF